jgi:hypothetical protein
MYTTFFLAIVIGLITGYLASYRGRNPYVWFFVGVFFGMIGLLFLFLLPAVNDDEIKSDEEIKSGELGEAVLNNTEEKLGLEQEELLKSQWYYLDSEHKQSSALSFDDLKNFWVKGIVKDVTYVWREGMEDWKKIHELSSLMESLRSN